MQTVTEECVGNVVNIEMLTGGLTAVNQMKAELTGDIAFEQLNSLLPVGEFYSSKTVTFIKGGSLLDEESQELKRFLDVFGGANERALMKDYNRIYAVNITEDEILTIKKINEFAEYLLDDEKAFRLQRQNGAKIYTEAGNFEVVLNGHNFFKPTIRIEKNSKEKIYFTKNADNTESILSTWFTN